MTSGATWMYMRWPDPGSPCKHCRRPGAEHGVDGKCLFDTTTYAATATYIPFKQAVLASVTASTTTYFGYVSGF